MANECNNYLVITGPADEIERFVRSTTRIVKLLDGTMSTQPCFALRHWSLRHLTTQPTGHVKTGDVNMMSITWESR